MKDRSLRILAAVSILILSLACSTLIRTEETPTPDPYIFEPVTTLLKIDPASLPNAQTGAEYEVEMRVSDNVTPLNSVFISNGTLPAGLELVFVDGEDGENSAKISGMPEETGTFTFTVFFSCVGTMVAGQTAEMEYTLIVE